MQGYLIQFVIQTYTLFITELNQKYLSILLYVVG